MYTIGIDTSHLFLLLVLMNEDRTVDAIQLDCFKQQSEYILVKLDELLYRNKVSIEEVNKVVLTIGPGSYTGVRIGMTVAKVLGSIAKKEVYSISTLQLYAGKRDCVVLMDARAKRVYYGQYKDGMPVCEDHIEFNEDVQKIVDEGKHEFIGDLHLFGQNGIYPNLTNNFFELKDCWKKVENVDALVPTYLKSKEEYL